jgi:hypothetical protein
MEKYKQIIDQAKVMVQRWDILIQTAVVDDDFPEMRERFELELHRLKRVINEAI